MHNHQKLDQATAGYTGGLGMLLNLVSDLYFDLALKQPALVVDGQFLTNPEQIMEHYGLSEQQRRIVYSWDREKPAAAVAEEIVRTDPFQLLRGNLWPGPCAVRSRWSTSRGASSSPSGSARGGDAGDSRGLGRAVSAAARCPISSSSAWPATTASRRRRSFPRGKDLENEVFDVTWDTSGLPDGVAPRHSRRRRGRRGHLAPRDHGRAVSSSLGAGAAEALRHAGPALLAPGELFRVLRFAERLPPSCEAFGIECRLSQARRQVDFGFALPRRYPEVEAFARALAPPGSRFWPTLLALRAAGATRRRRCSGWWTRCSSSSMPRARTATAPSPSPSRESTDSTPRAVDRAVFADTLHAFSDETHDETAEWLERLPEDFILTDAACLTGARAGGGLRVGLLLPTARLAALLRALDWPGPHADACRLIDALCPAGTVRLQLDLKANQKLGFEIQRDSSPRAAPAWRSLLDQLVGRGLCSSAERDALLHWPGTTRERADPRLLCRQLSHLKVSLDVEGNLDAKAYLFATRVFSLFD